MKMGDMLSRAPFAACERRRATGRARVPSFCPSPPACFSRTRRCSAPDELDEAESQHRVNLAHAARRILQSPSEDAARATDGARHGAQREVVFGVHDCIPPARRTPWGPNPLHASTGPPVLHESGPTKVQALPARSGAMRSHPGEPMPPDEGLPRAWKCHRSGTPRR